MPLAVADNETSLKECLGVDSSFVLKLNSHQLATLLNGSEIPNAGTWILQTLRHTSPDILVNVKNHVKDLRTSPPKLKKLGQNSAVLSWKHLRLFRHPLPS